VSRSTAAVRPAVEHLLGLVLAAVAATPWLAVTGADAGVAHLAAALAGATAVTLLVTRVRRTGGATEILVSGAALAAVLLVVVVGDPTGGTEVLRGLRDGVPRILSTDLPLLDVAWAGVPGAVVVWCTAGVITTAVARTRSVAWPVLAGLLCFLGGYALTLGGRPEGVGEVAVREALLMAAVAGSFALVRGYHRVPGSRTSTVLARTVASLVTVAVALGLGAVAADRGPFVPEDPVRPRLTPAATEVEPEAPLLVTRRLRTEEPDRPVAHLTVDGAWSGYVPIAVLDRYDGRVWSSADEQLSPTGGLLPVTLPPTGGPGVTVRDLDVAATGGWLPYVSRVERIEGASVVHDGGDRLRLVEPEDQPTYELSTAHPARTLDDEGFDDDQPTAGSSGAVVPLDVVRRPSENRAAGERVCRLLALTAAVARDEADAPPATGELSVRGAPCGRRGPDRIGFLRALASELGTGRTVAVDEGDGASAGGPESLADLLELVGPPTVEGRATGAPEQFAGAFALLADHYGLPVRLVTGFRVEEPEVGVARLLHGRDAWTWAEVAVDGAGWVVVDPTPSAEDVDAPEELAQPEALEQPEGAPHEAPAELGVEAETLVVGPPPPAEPADPRPVVVAVVLGVAVVLLLPLLVAGGRRLARRVRRRRGDARRRVVGAWHELLDVAYGLEGPDVAARTTEELVEALSRRDPELGADLGALGPLVDRAVFSSRAVGDDEAVRAWTVVRGARRRLRRTAGVRTRVANGWRVAPRSVTSPRRAGGGATGPGGRGRRRRRAIPAPGR
jgi:hypothetical protein